MADSQAMEDFFRAADEALSDETSSELALDDVRGVFRLLIRGNWEGLPDGDLKALRQMRESNVIGGPDDG